MLKQSIIRSVSADSPLAYFFLAFIAMAGLSYINFMPGLVNALAGGIGFTEAEAGQVVAMNGYGGLVGSTAAIFLVRRIQWRPAIYTFLAILTLVEIGTLWVSDYSMMLGWRFLAGVFGGLCVGIGFAVLARLNNPDRAFGTLLFIQFSIGSIVIYILPGLEEMLNAYSVFYVMASFVLLSLIFLPLLPGLTLKKETTNQSASLSNPSGSGKFFGNELLLMLAILTYQVAASAIWAYVGLIGMGANIDSESVSVYIATTGMLGLLGAMLPVITGNRFGRMYWIVAGMAMSTIAAVLLNFSQQASLYIVAMALLFFAWPAVQSYLLAVTAEMDSSGRLSTIAAVVSSIGLATGPLMASGLLNEDDFSVMLYASAAIFLFSFFLLFKPVQSQENDGSLQPSPNQS